MAEGSSQIFATGGQSVTLRLKGSSTDLTTAFEEDEITCNQQRSPPSNPYHYVGGELFTANKLAVLSPYLALIGLAGVVVSAVLTVKRRKF